MIRRIAALALFSLSILCACATSGQKHAVSGNTLVFLKTGPRSGQLSAEQHKEAFAGHFSNMERLAHERKLLAAGPFGDTRHDPALRGLFVLASDSPEEARAWALTDPTTIAGVFTLEFHTLRTDAPLLAAMESDLERRAAAKAQGLSPAPSNGMRGYVLLSAEHGDLARPELEALGAGGGVFLIAELDGTRCLALLDAPDVAAAQQRFGDLLGRIGSHTLDDWFASAELARLNEFAQR